VAEADRGKAAAEVHQPDIEDDENRQPSDASMFVKDSREDSSSG
jgi:hypothetical protein